MKILVLGGSPNKNGSTQILIEIFARGAKEAGHTVTVLNVAHMDVRPCALPASPRPCSWALRSRAQWCKTPL